MSKINYDYLKPDLVWYEYADGQGGKKFLLASILLQRKIKSAAKSRQDKPRNVFEVQKIMPGIIPFDYYTLSDGPQTREEIYSVAWPRTEYQIKALQDLEALTGEKPAGKARFAPKQAEALKGIEAPKEKEPEPPKNQEPPADYEDMTDSQLKAAAIAAGLKPETAERKSREALIAHLNKGGNK